MKMSKLNLIATMGLLVKVLSGDSSVPASFRHSEPKHRERTRQQHIDRINAAQDKRLRRQAKRLSDRAAGGFLT